MKKYYIVEFGNISSEFFGEFESLNDAKDAAFEKMQEGDLLVGFDMDVDAEYTDTYGYKTVYLDKADEKEQSFLYRTDDTLEDVPEGLWYWGDVDKRVFTDIDYYYGNGEVWEGNEPKKGDFIMEKHDMEEVGKMETTKRRFEVYQDSGEGIVMFVWDKQGKEIVWAHNGYEYTGKEQLKEDMNALKNGVDPEDWDGNGNITENGYGFKTWEELGTTIEEEYNHILDNMDEYTYMFNQDGIQFDDFWGEWEEIKENRPEEEKKEEPSKSNTRKGR